MSHQEIQDIFNHATRGSNVTVELIPLILCDNDCSETSQKIALKD